MMQPPPQCSRGSLVRPPQRDDSICWTKYKLVMLLEVLVERDRPLARLRLLQSILRLNGFASDASRLSLAGMDAAVAQLTEEQRELVSFRRSLRSQRKRGRDALAPLLLHQDDQVHPSDAVTHDTSSPDLIAPSSAKKSRVDADGDPHRVSNGACWAEAAPPAPPSESQPEPQPEHPFGDPPFSVRQFAPRTGLHWRVWPTHCIGLLRTPDGQPSAYALVVRSLVPHMRYGILVPRCRGMTTVRVVYALPNPSSMLPEACKGAVRALFTQVSEGRVPVQEEEEEEEGVVGDDDDRHDTRDPSDVDDAGAAERQWEAQAVRLFDQDLPSGEPFVWGYDVTLPYPVTDRVEVVCRGDSYKVYRMEVQQ